ncbi:MAG TPA: endosialidase [Defluviitaleaceae bacterium]|nr:endosialidase [Candidatus Epulonipiscium sp.]HOQ17580.1 endosialidase [Defluviitaleaceae bacterium]HPT76471.1 endosialidase [Defluviitaleaceae bacterium]HQD50462.1 endosialidase [Defluviitaleaceae bacterium]
MAVVEELIRLEDDNSLSFGNYLMDTKKKVIDFEVDGDLYKVKTYNKITKLEKNGILLYESVPGTTVHNFTMNEKQVTFAVEGENTSQITMELEPEKEYKIYVDNVQVGKVKASLAGKVTFSIDFTTGKQNVRIEKI